MSKLLTRYWFNSKVGLGVGVTAHSLDESIALVKAEPLAMICEPNFDTARENVDIRELDQDHVIPNMGVCTNFGIWFPNLNS